MKEKSKLFKQSTGRGRRALLQSGKHFPIKAGSQTALFGRHGPCLYHEKSFGIFRQDRQEAFRPIGELAENQEHLAVIVNHERMYVRQ